MKFVYGERSEQIADERRQRYLERWPVHRQLEAHKEAAEGRPELFNEMLADMAAIKEQLSYSNGS